MRIGVLGTGGMADALATHWVRAGHEVTVGDGRGQGGAARDAHRGGAKPASLRVAAEFGQVVLAALPFDAGVSVARELRAALDGKVLLDCSNPVGPGFRLLTEGGPSAARQLAAAAPGAHVVKAFNLCHEDVWRMRPPVFDGRPLAVPICGDDRAALARVRELVRDVGCAPVAAAVSNGRGSWRRPPRCSSRCGSPSQRMSRRSLLRWPMRPDRAVSMQKPARWLMADGVVVRRAAGGE